MSSRNPYGIGKKATNKVNIVKLGNRLANQFRSDIMGQAIENYNTATNQPPPKTTPAIPIRDGTISTQKIDNAAITSEKLTKDISLPPTSKVVLTDISTNSLSTIQYVNTSIATTFAELQFVENVDETLNTFSDDVTALFSLLPPIDSNLSIIENQDWINESNITNESITGEKYDVLSPLPTGIQIAASTNTTGNHPATTSYLRTQYELFIQDASVNSVGNLARSIANMTDASFQQFSAGNPDKQAFDNSYNHVLQKQTLHDNSLVTLFSINQSAIYSQIKTSVDASIANIPLNDTSFSLFFQGHSLTSSIETVKQIIAKNDSSLVQLNNSIGSSILNNSFSGFVDSSRLESNLTLSQNAALLTAPTNKNSTQAVSTSYVKSELAGILATSEAIQNYIETVNAIQGDASFAYHVIQNSNQLDASVAEFRTNVDSLDITNNIDINRQLGEYGVINSTRSLQDNSVNQFSLSEFSQHTDACMNSLNTREIQTSTDLANIIGKTDTSLAVLFTQTENAATQYATLLAKYDASYSYMDTRLGSLDNTLVDIDNSLNSFLDSRENSFATGFQTSWNALSSHIHVADLSLNSLTQSYDSSAIKIATSLNTSDNSFSLLGPMLVDISNILIPMAASSLDNSFPQVRDLFVNLDNSLNSIVGPIDSCLNAVSLPVSQSERLASATDSSLSYQLTERYETLSTNFDLDVDYNENAATLVSLNFNTGETRWAENMATTDASMEDLIVDYTMVIQDLETSAAELKIIDASMAPVYQEQEAKIRVIDSSLEVITMELPERILHTDISTNLASQRVNSLNYSVADSSINWAIETSQYHDLSLSSVEPAGWVDGARLQNAVALPSGTITNTTLADDASGTQIATTDFFQKRVIEVVGMAIPPLTSLNVLGDAVQNTGDYSLFVGSALNDVSSNLSSIRSAINDMSLNTGGDFNYDASMNYLEGRIGGLDTSFNGLDTDLTSWTSSTDESLNSVFGIIGRLDSSVNALDGSNIALLASRVWNQEGTIENYKIGYDASLNALSQTFIVDVSRIRQLARDMSNSLGQINDLSSAFTRRFRVSDGSYGIALEKHDSIAYRNTWSVLDSSFGDYNTEISTVNSGVRNYLRNSVGGAEYVSSFNMLTQKLVSQDASLGGLEGGFGNSYQSVDTGNTTRDLTLSGLPDTFSTVDLNRVGVVLANNNTTGDITTIGGAGWVTTDRLADASLLVLPSGVRISSVGVTGNIITASGVRMALNGLVSTAPVALNTLGEIAEALRGDASLSATLQGRLPVTEASLSLLEQDTRISTMVGEYAGRVDSVNSLPYTSLESTTSGLYERIATNDASTNSAGGTLTGVNTKVESAIRRLETNDASTNYVNGRFLVAENAIPVIDNSLNGVVPLVEQLDVSLQSERNTADIVLTGLGTNDASTNLLGSSTGVIVREASANNVIALLGRPDNFRVTGTTTTSITCEYVEPVLKDAIGVSSYRLTATPTYGTTTVVSNTTAVGTNAISATPLVSGAVYDLSLAATNQYGVVVVSGVSSPTVLASPTGLTGSASTTSSFTASWTSGGGVFTKYAFRLENGGVNVSTGDLSANVLSRNFTGLTDGTPYLVAVRSANPFVQSVDVSMIYGTIFSAPSGLTFVSRTATDLSFSVTGTMKPYLRYNISYRRLDGTAALATDVSSNFRLRDLSAGRIYDVSVNIQNAFGVSAWSSVVKNSTDLSVPAISAGAITTSGMSITFSSLPTQDCSYVLRTVPNVTQYILTAGATSQVLSGLTQSTLYNIFLDASNLYTSTFSTISATTANIYTTATYLFRLNGVSTNTGTDTGNTLSSSSTTYSKFGGKTTTSLSITRGSTTVFITNRFNIASSANSNGTISLNVYPREYASGYCTYIWYLLNTASPLGNRFGVWFVNTAPTRYEFIFGSNGGGDNYITFTPLNNELAIDTWTNITITWTVNSTQTSGIVRLYLNGNQRASLTVTNWSTFSSSTNTGTNERFLSISENRAGSYFGGSISNFAYWNNRALTAAEAGSLLGTFT